MENSISVSQIHQVQTYKSMQRLKFELVNGHGVLVDNKDEIKEGDWYYDSGDVNFICKAFKHTTNQYYRSKIIFAEKELNLEGIPVFEWRDFEVQKLAEKSSEIQEVSYTIPHAETYKHGFIDGYKSNTAKYTESDLRKAFNAGTDYEYAKIYDGHKGYGDGRTIREPNEEQFIQSLQKYPSYIEVDGIIGNKANIVNVIW